MDLKRHLRYENEVEIQTLPEDSNFQGKLSPILGINCAHAKWAAYTDLLVPEAIPDEPPSPRSYWIDLHPIEGAGRESGFIPEESPEPFSYWIDLRPIGGLVAEVAPEPTSIFLELHPLDDSSTPEISPSPTELKLELLEL